MEVELPVVQPIVNEAASHAPMDGAYKADMPLPSIAAPSQDHAALISALKLPKDRQKALNSKPVPYLNFVETVSTEWILNFYGKQDGKSKLRFAELKSDEYLKKELATPISVKGYGELSDVFPTTEKNRRMIYNLDKSTHFCFDLALDSHTPDQLYRTNVFDISPRAGIRKGVEPTTRKNAKQTKEDDKGKARADHRAKKDWRHPKIAGVPVVPFIGIPDNDQVCLVPIYQANKDQEEPNQTIPIRERKGFKLRVSYNGEELYTSKSSVFTEPYGMDSSPFFLPLRIPKELYHEAYILHLELRAKSFTTNEYDAEDRKWGEAGTIIIPCFSDLNSVIEQLLNDQSPSPATREDTVQFGLLLRSLQSGDHSKVIEILTKNPKLVHVRGQFGYTPLHFTARDGWKGMAEILLEAGADISAKTNLDETPLMIAACRGQHTVLLALLEHLHKITDAEKVRDCINAKTSYGMSLLTKLVIDGCHDLVSVICKFKPILILDHENHPPSYYARVMKLQKMEKYSVK